MSEQTCAYTGCDDSADVERVYVSTGKVRGYCEEHDPVDEYDDHFASLEDYDDLQTP